MWDLDNRTPFPAFQGFERDKRGSAHWLVFAKASFEIRTGRPCLFASEQAPLAFAPVYRNAEGRMGELLQDIDPGFPKKNTDLLLCGHARLLPGAAGSVEFAVDRWRKRVDIHPATVWSRTLKPVATGTSTAATVWLGYTEAFGGTDGEKPFEDNPVGCGYRAGDGRTVAAGLDLPRLAYPGERLSSPTGAIRAAAFGPIPRDWRARSRFAGTYDDAWRRSRAPFLPADFDERFHQSAPEDQQWDGILLGGVGVQVTGLGEDEIAMELPTLSFECLTRLKGRWQAQEMRLQTCHIDSDERRLTLCYCASLEVGSTASEVAVDESRLRLDFAASRGFRVRPEDAHRFPS